MEKLKAIKACKDIGSDAIKTVKSLISTLKNFGKDAADLAKAIPVIVEDIKKGDILANGKKCQDAGKEEIYDCYALIYGELKKGGKGEGEGGCCNVF